MAIDSHAERGINSSSTDEVAQQGHREWQTPDALLVVKHFTSKERQICALLLDGCGNAEIAKQLGMAKRTVKAHFNRLFMRFQIVDGIKRVKLAVILYRVQRTQEKPPG